MMCYVLQITYIYIQGEQKFEGVTDRPLCHLTEAGRSDNGESFRISLLVANWCYRVYALCIMW